jgi:hypothetical protein
MTPDKKPSAAENFSTKFSRCCYTIKCDTVEDGLMRHALEGNLDG